MKMTTAEQPQIILPTDDYNRLIWLLDHTRHTETTERLREEVERAEIVAREALPDNVVRMNCSVTFTVVSTGKTLTHTLVYPHEVGSTKNLSVLTPVGSALLGLTVGQQIEWPLENKTLMRVHIDRVQNSDDAPG